MTKQNAPLFSIILAFRNEEDFLKDCLESFDKQTIAKEKWEVILIDSCSTDTSREIADNYIKMNRNSRLINNPLQNSTAGWNEGLKIAKGKYFCLASAHSITDKHYLSKAENFFRENNDIQALGGKITKIGLGKLSKSIAAATNTPFAMGGSYYRIGDKPKKINVIGIGIYLRDIIDSIGKFNSRILRSGDWEFNYRVCSYGYNMFFNPELVVKVFTRANYKSIFIQQFRTSFWKVRIWAKHPRSLLPRHIIPALSVLWLILVPIIFSLNKPILSVWILSLLLYLLMAIYSAIKASKEDAKWYYVMPTFPIIHIAYGLGFITGMLRWSKYLLKSLTKIKLQPK
ncbi:MAG: glycosyltransferase [candidate division Zixibacteria bacterium]|nr:glycosyltransferase [candidate division Zixibacteria bacterium]